MVRAAAIAGEIFKAGRLGASRADVWRSESPRVPGRFRGGVG